jgi:hypothetical protein
MRKLYNEELHNLYSLPSIIRIIKFTKSTILGGVVSCQVRTYKIIILLWFYMGVKYGP